MRARTVQFVGGGLIALLVGVAIAGVGLYVMLQTTSGDTYVIAVQPAKAVSDPSETRVDYADRTDHQRRAFDSGLADSGHSFGPRGSLDRLDEGVVTRESERYVSR